MGTRELLASPFRAFKALMSPRAPSSNKSRSISTSIAIQHDESDSDQEINTELSTDINTPDINTPVPRSVKIIESDYSINKAAALVKKAEYTERPHIQVCVTGRSNNKQIVIEYNTAAFELIRGALSEYYYNPENAYSINSTSKADRGKVMVESDSMKVYEKVGNKLKFLYTINFYRTTCRFLVNGNRIDKFTQDVLPAIQDLIQQYSPEIEIMNIKIRDQLQDILKKQDQDIEVDIREMNNLKSGALEIAGPDEGKCIKEEQDTRMGIKENVHVKEQDNSTDEKEQIETKTQECVDQMEPIESHQQQGTKILLEKENAENENGGSSSDGKKEVDENINSQEENKSHKKREDNNPKDLIEDKQTIEPEDKLGPGSANKGQTKQKKEERDKNKHRDNKVNKQNNRIVNDEKEETTSLNRIETRLIEFLEGEIELRHKMTVDLLNSEIDRINKEKNELQKDNSSLKKDLHAARKETTQLKEQLKEHNKQDQGTIDIALDYKILKIKFSSKEGECQILQNQNERLHKHIENIICEHQNTLTEMKQWQNHNNMSDGSINEMEMKVGELKTILASKEEEICELKRQAHTLHDLIPQPKIKNVKMTQTESPKGGIVSSPSRYRFIQGSNDILSNMSRTNLKVGRQTYHSIEQAYHHMSALQDKDSMRANAILNEKNPFAIKARFGNRSIPCPAKSKIMSDLLYERTKQDSAFKQKLKESGDQILLHAVKDSFWGIGLESYQVTHPLDMNNIQGENKHGKLLMEIRENIKSKTNDSTPKEEPDLVIWGDSNVTRISTERMQSANVKAKVLTTNTKTFPGVSQELHTTPKCKNLMLHFGTNDLVHTRNPITVMEAAESAIKKAQDLFPDTGILISSVLPRQMGCDTDKIMKDILILNNLLRYTCSKGGKNIHFLEHNQEHFMAPGMMTDGLHLSNWGTSQFEQNIIKKLHNMTV